MSARSGLVGRLVLMGLSEQAAERAVDAFAHELAEKQRAERAAWEGRAFEGGPTGLGQMDRIIDLIDPEVPNGGGLEESNDGS